MIAKNTESVKKTDVPSSFKEEWAIAKDVQRLGVPIGGEDFRALALNYLKLVKKTVKIVKIGDSTHNKLIKTQKKLSQTLNELRETQQTLIQQERLGALGQMARGIAHDFNNALQPIILAASMLDSDENIFKDKEFGKKYVDMILKTAQDAANTVKRLARFYRPLGPGEKVEIDARELINEALELTKPKWKDEAQNRGCSYKISTDFREPCLILGLHDSLVEVLMNLIFNCLDSFDWKGAKKGNILLSSYCEGEWGIISIADNGAGMNAETKARCIEPFYTTKLQRGAGLGLSTAYGIIQGHKGKLVIESEEGKGTIVKVYLPVVVHDEKQEKKAKASSPEHAHHKKHYRVLVVDDEEVLRNILAATLQRYGHDVTTASSGTDGWKKFQMDQYDIVVTDQAMPGMPGDQLAKKIKAKDPKMPVIMLTGFGDLMKAQGQEPDHIDKLLSKPVAPRNLHEAILHLAH